MDVTKQQVFDASWKGLKAQGFVKSKVLFGHNEHERWKAWGSGRCTPHDGSRCCAVQHVLNVYEELNDNGPFTNADHPMGAILNPLMMAHNDASSPDDMERRLRAVAKAHALTIPGDDDGFQRFLERVVTERVDVRDTGTSPSYGVIR